MAHAGAEQDPIPTILYILSTAWLGHVLQEDAKGAEVERKQNPSSIVLFHRVEMIAIGRN